MLSVCFLWHMHQPYYVDPSTQTAVMPWVRLHAVKGYWDMVCLAEEYPGIHLTFNLTPVLVKQIQELAAGTVRDEWLEWARTPASDLTEEQRTLLLENYFKINWDNLVRSHPRYWQLLQRRGADWRQVDHRKVVKQWSDADFRDLQVWFNLAWCGYKACASFPELVELKRKGQGFSEDDKKVVFKVHSEILRQVLGKYRALAERGQVELSTTPFFHPIMPLVYDTNLAKRCMPYTPLPPRFSQTDDVRAQLRLAVEQHEAVFGRRPIGLWPSEGSVCPELIPLFKEAGIRWFGTDEEILFRSLSNEEVTPEKGKERLAIYQGYEVEHEGVAVCASFRDRSLSDFIGFSASKNHPELAAEFLMGHLRRIAKEADRQTGLAPIILDGENAWEHFADGGERFLRNLYTSLGKDSALSSVSFGEYFEKHAPKKKIRKLHTGSWIRADFDIWIGDPEENRAWELLGQARRHVEEQGKHVDEAARRKALWEIYAAEGSDWFWWYGPDFHTDSDHMFDLLFRRHLENVYHSLGTKPPDILKTRIRQIGLRIQIIPPKGLIQPTIDGLVTTFFEWNEAGSFEIGKTQSTMYRTERVLRRIYFGFDLQNFHLRLDCDPKASRKELRLRVHFVEPKYQVLEVASDGGKFTLARSTDGGVHFEAAQEFSSLKWGEILELSLPFAALGVNGGDRLGFNVEELRGDVDLGRHPENGLIRVQLPRPDFEMENWLV